MRSESQVVHRKTFAPWYDTETVCLIVLAVMLAVGVFAFLGILVALETPEFNGFAWVPVLLTGMSLWVFLSVAIRLIRRIIGRSQKRYLKDFSVIEGGF